MAGAGLIVRTLLLWRFIALVGAGLLLAACAASAATPKATPAVRLGTNPISPSNAFVWVAQQAGLFPKAGVDVDVQGLGGGQRMNSLVAGQIDGEAGAGAQESSLLERTEPT